MAIYKTGDLEIDNLKRVVEVRGQRIHLTPREFDLLALLAEARGNHGRLYVVTKKMMVDWLYRDGDVPELKIIDVFFCKMRKKITAATGENYIETVWGRGYRLVDPAEMDTRGRVKPLAITDATHEQPTQVN